MIFDFAGRTRTPVKLSGDIPYIHPDVRPRLFQALEAGCRCSHDGERTATLTQRNGAAWLQCDACGSSLGSAMPRAAHQKFHTYPAWRIGLVEHYDAALDAFYAEQRAARDEAYEDWKIAKDKAYEDGRLAAREAYVRRSLEYDQWCRTSPDWKVIKEKIFWRSRGHCEACLIGNAEVVHHITYQFGKLPPAWHLRAVCNSCHERLHCPGDEWCDYGMARGQE